MRTNSVPIVSLPRAPVQPHSYDSGIAYKVWDVAKGMEVSSALNTCAIPSLYSAGGALKLLTSGVKFMHKRARLESLRG
jgi:hypothetical protein